MKQYLKKWDQIIRDYEANVTHIYGRELFHRMFDVTFHSVLQFKFKGQLIVRGWIESILIGDTSIGKSEIAMSMSIHCGIPKPYKCENASAAGLIGGVQQTGGGHFTLTWGLFPRLDKRGACLEEVAGLPIEIIAQMSDLRSSGVASITKISGGETMARCRKFWIGNPRRQGRQGNVVIKVSEFPFGIMAIPQVIGLDEDVRRFEFGTAARISDVSPALINAKTRPRVKHVYGTEQAKCLMMWAWTRRPDDVVFERGVEDKIIDLALAMCGKYKADIPLVEPGEQRFKVARVAVSLAARFHSTDKTGEKVIVKKDHVDLANWFFEQCYNTEAAGYDRFSLAGKVHVKVDTREYNALLSSLGGPEAGALVESIAMSEDISRLAVVDWRDQADMLRNLLRMGLVKQTPTGYHKTDKFNRFYKKFTEQQIDGGFDV